MSILLHQNDTIRPPHADQTLRIATRGTEMNDQYLVQTYGAIEDQGGWSGHAFDHWVLVP